jgi:SAM-dependent methyltransferase
LSIFFEIHRDLPREAPGDDESTRRALALLTGLPPRPRIVDVGCGPGTPTLILAAQTGGCIAGVDTHRPYLDRLVDGARARGVADRTRAVQASMSALPFRDESIDLMWSEGAIYIVGFEQGLVGWRPLLTPGGYVVVSELSWLRPHPPSDVAAFWSAAYPGMRSVARNLETVRAHYQLVGYFVLPSSAWWGTGYYGVLQERIDRLRVRHASDADAIRELNDTAAQIELYRTYSDWYGYVFYAMRMS